MPSKKLRVLPLGGLGEIGKNMTVIEYDGRIVVVDTGLMFPTAEMHGIDLVLPDFSYLRDRADDIEAIVLTHGHEDHVGALPYVLREIGDAAGDLRRPADDRHGPLQARRAQARATRRCRSCRPGEKVQRGPFELELVHLAHSIPDMRGVLHHHRGRLDADDRRLQVRPDPGRRPPGRHPAPGRARHGRAAAALRRLDQRRPARASRRRSRASARRCWSQFSQCEGRIIVTSFASNIHRVQQVIDAAVAARPQGRPGRPLDAQELQHRLQPRDRQSARRALHPAARDRGLPRREGRRDLHRQPGRAALGAAADGQQRPPRRGAALRRHGRLLGHAGARQRARGERDDRPHLRDRRHRDHRQGRADPRLRPRLAGGAEADAQPDQAAAT